jgi:hypothetical protein
VLDPTDHARTIAKAIGSATISDENAEPNNTARGVRLALLVTKSSKKESDETIDIAVVTAEMITLFFGALAVVGVAVDFVLPAFNLEPIDNWSGAMVAVGVAMQLLFGFRGSGFQGELTRRSRNRLAGIIERATWRSLVAEQASALLYVELPKLTPASIVFSYPVGSEEARYVVHELAIPFRHHNWKVGFRAEAYEGFPEYELRVATTFSGEQSTIAKDVLSALVAAGIPFVRGEVPPSSWMTASGDATPAPGVTVYVCPKHMLHPDNMAAMGIRETVMHPPAVGTVHPSPFSIGGK